jgi:hypothetical protein
MSRVVARQALAARNDLLRSKLPRQWKFVIRHRRWFPQSLRVRALIIYSDAKIDAERELPRRWRRELKGERMLPAKETK